MTMTGSFIHIGNLAVNAMAPDDIDPIEQYESGQDIAFWKNANTLGHGKIAKIFRRGLRALPDVYWIETSEGTLVEKLAKHIIKRPEA